MTSENQNVESCDWQGYRLIYRVQSQDLDGQLLFSMPDVHILGLYEIGATEPPAEGNLLRLLPELQNYSVWPWPEGHAVTLILEFLLLEAGIFTHDDERLSPTAREFIRIDRQRVVSEQEAMLKLMAATEREKRQ